MQAEIRRLEIREKELEAALASVESALSHAEKKAKHNATSTELSVPPTPEVHRQFELERAAAAEYRRTSTATAATLRSELEAARSRVDDLQALTEQLQSRLNSKKESFVNSQENNESPEIIKSLQAQFQRAQSDARRAAQRALEASQELDDVRAKLKTNQQRLSTLENENAHLTQRLASTVKAIPIDTNIFSKNSQTHHKLKRLISYDNRRASKGLFAAGLTLLDDAGLALAALLRSSPVVRCACLLYLAFLHLYTFALVTAKAAALAFSDDDNTRTVLSPRSATDNSPPASSRLRGRGDS
uniref:Uncharacterized protein n=1 Tax=Aureoumbra lagunensis TaxID=44058 RepID=A0A7S3JR55_9STRA